MVQLIDKNGDISARFHQLSYRWTMEEEKAEMEREFERRAAAVSRIKQPRAKAG